MSSTTVALAGATGNLGLPILKQLLAAGFSVVVLSRTGSSSTSKLPSSSQITIKEVDYTSEASLTPALKGVSVVVCTIGTGAVGEQKPLIDASVAAGVSRFIPSEFGSDTSNPKSAVLPVFAGKKATHEYLEAKTKQNPNFSYTLIHNSAFLDWGMAVGFIINPKERKAVVYDGGDRPFSTTRLDAIGRAVVGVVQHLPETKNRLVYIHEAVVTQNQLIAAAKKFQSGGKEWEITHATSQQSMEDSYAELKKDKPDFGKAMVGFLPAAVYGEGYGGDFSAHLDNELLGIKELSAAEVEEVVKQYA